LLPEKGGRVTANISTRGLQEAPVVHSLRETDIRRIQPIALAGLRGLGGRQKCTEPVALRAGVIANGRSHLNLKGIRYQSCPDRLYAAPCTQEALLATLRDFAAEGVNFLIVDGGDGTVRDVLTTAGKVFDRSPAFAVVPSGKTNALALDLGIPPGWTARDAFEAARSGRFEIRSPLEITRAGSSAPELRGFLFGAGRFVHATELAQRTHMAGAFNGVAVALSLGWSVFQTLFGGADNPWRRGETIGIRYDEGAYIDRSLYLLLASTMERMPLNLKPFGRVRQGLKVLAIDAPPRHVLASLVPLLAGWERQWLCDAGYHRSDLGELALALNRGFILDGEHYAGGEITLSRGEPVLFAVP
jgi:hypothetical protein